MSDEAGGLVTVTQAFVGLKADFAEKALGAAAKGYKFASGVTSSLVFTPINAAINYRQSTATTEESK